MARIDGAVRVIPFLNGAVIGGDQDRHALAASRFHHPAGEVIHLFDRLEDGGFVLDMAQHINVGKVGDDAVFFFITDLLKERLRNLFDTQLRDDGVVIDFR